MTDTTEKLLPCAHFNSKARMRDVETDDCSGYVYCVQCTNCEASSGLYGSKEQARAAWNRRVAEKPKWTTETPTEEGWYWHKDAHNKPKMVYHKLGRVCFLSDSCVFGQAYEYWAEDIEEFGEHTQWLKIDIPAVPEEGESND